LAAAAVAAEVVHRFPVALAAAVAVLVDSLDKPQEPEQEDRAVTAVLRVPMRSRFVAQVVVALLRSVLMAMLAVALAVRVTPTTVTHTLAVAAAVQRMSVALPAVVALADQVATALRRLATQVQLARDLVVVVPVALASDQPRLLAEMAAMALL
jgi:hypothetical protein